MSCGDDSTAIFRSNFHHHAHDGGRPGTGVHSSWFRFLARASSHGPLSTASSHGSSSQAGKKQQPGQPAACACHPGYIPDHVQ